MLPNFQNPTGVTLAVERRQALIEMADRYGVPIIEDDPYGQLRFEGSHLPSVVALDGQFRESGNSPYRGNVIYLSTFSKTLSPGIRLAWVVAPQEVIRKLVQAKQGADLHTATFNQMVAYEVSRGGFLDRHVWMIRRVYGERLDVMLEAMEEFFPDGCHWTRPKGGLFLWGILPENMQTRKVLEKAIEKKVAFVPGDCFYARGGGENTMRLNFSFSSPEVIRLGIERLGNVIREQLEVKTLH